MLNTIVSKFYKRFCGENENVGWQQRYYSLFDRSIVDKIAENYHPGEFIDKIAAEIGVSTTTIRDTISNRYTIPTVGDVFLPDDDFLNTFHSGCAPFVDFSAMPQPTTGNGIYRLVVSNPALISVDAFNNQGIEICLGDYASINHVLSLWRERSIGINSRVEKFLLGVYELGGHTFSVTNADGVIVYRFETAKGVMGGKISNQFFAQLREELACGSLQLNCPNKEKVTVRVGISDSPEQLLVADIALDSEVQVKPLSVEKKEIKNIAINKDILLVEDDIHFGQALADILETKGYSVCCVCSVEEFEHRIRAGDLNIRMVISDYRLGGRDGREVMRACSNMSAPVPVVFLTADEDPVTEASLIQLGTQAFVKKSESPMILLAWVTRLLNGLSGSPGGATELGIAT